LLASPTQPPLALYYSPSCPYCQDVLRVLEGLELDVQLRDINRDRAFRDELVQARGRATVPVLKIESETPVWMPESLDIIRELRQVAGVEQAVPQWVDRVVQVSRPLGFAMMLAAIFLSGAAADYLLWGGMGVLGLGLVRRAILDPHSRR
jgi:glutaredoxin